MSLCAYLLEDEKKKTTDLTVQLGICVAILNEQSAHLKQLKKEFSELKKERDELVVKNNELLKYTKMTDI